MDKVYIKNILQKILDKEFANTQKRRVNDYSDRLNFACPQINLLKAIDIIEKVIHASD
jgi:hypothetical protein